MSQKFGEVLRDLAKEMGISEDLIKKVTEEVLLTAYKKNYGTIDNAEVRFNEEPDGWVPTLYSRKEVVEDVYEEVKEIELDDAKKLEPESEIGDTLFIEVDPLKDFDYSAVQAAQQKMKQLIRDIQKDSLYSEFKQKEGQLIIGYYQREKNGNIFVDLGRVEGVLPKKFQSPRETYKLNDRLKCYVYEVSKNGPHVSITLSRTHSEFVQRLFENEIPELTDGSIEIKNIVRDAGFRTKMAVYSRRSDIDPVGSCVGLKGVRIQGIISELEGERIDVVRYDSDPKKYIANALSPASPEAVYILDDQSKTALAIVKESQLSLAIGKQGQNVRLANRLVDWNIDVKTEQQFAEMERSPELRQAVESLFNQADEIQNIRELSEIPARIADILAAHGIEKIEELLNLGSEAKAEITELSGADWEMIDRILSESVDIVENEEAVAPIGDAENTQSADESEVVEEVEVYECPECGHEITADMTSCPNCGVGLSFEYEEEEE